jgi:hypothetical protein
MSTFNPVAVSVGFTANKMVLGQILEVLLFTPADHHSTYVLHSSIANPEVYDTCVLPAHYHNLHAHFKFHYPDSALGWIQSLQSTRD